ncbi:hypothetical protein H0H92_012937, partial [Tricholoma furcatifolium]
RLGAKVGWLTRTDEAVETFALCFVTRVESVPRAPRAWHPSAANANANIAVPPPMPQVPEPRDPHPRLLSASYPPEDLARFLGSVTPTTCSVHAEMLEVSTPSSGGGLKSKEDVNKLKRAVTVGLVSADRDRNRHTRGTMSGPWQCA